MYVETRTTIGEVIADMHQEISYKANALLNSVHTLDVHPTFTSKPLIREALAELQGMLEITRRVSGDIGLPGDLHAKVIDAVNKANIATARKTR